jgi:hypothetical protein
MLAGGAWWYAVAAPGCGGTIICGGTPTTLTGGGGIGPLVGIVVAIGGIPPTDTICGLMTGI